MKTALTKTQQEFLQWLASRGGIARYCEILSWYRAGRQRWPSNLYQYVLLPLLEQGTLVRTQRGVYRLAVFTQLSTTDEDAEWEEYIRQKLGGANAEDK